MAKKTLAKSMLQRGRDRAFARAAKTAAFITPTEQAVKPGGIESAVALRADDRTPQQTAEYPSKGRLQLEAECNLLRRISAISWSGDAKWLKALTGALAAVRA